MSLACWHAKRRTTSVGTQSDAWRHIVYWNNLTFSEEYEQFGVNNTKQFTSSFFFYNRQASLLQGYLSLIS